MEAGNGNLSAMRNKTFMLKMASHHNTWQVSLQPAQPVQPKENGGRVCVFRNCSRDPLAGARHDPECRMAASVRDHYNPAPLFCGQRAPALMGINLSGIFGEHWRLVKRSTLFESLQKLVGLRKVLGCSFKESQTGLVWKGP